MPGASRADAGAVSLSSNWGCAVVGSGQVRCWGDNDYGQLGQGNESAVGDNPGERPVIVPLPGPAISVVTTSAGAVCAVMQAGDIRCWGNNNSGQAAQGWTGNIGDDPGEVPVSVDLGAGPKAIALAGGNGHFCAVTDLGGVRCWGFGSSGALDQGDTNNRYFSIPVSLPRPAVAIAATESSTCAVLDDGSLRCWGSSGSGELQQGDTVTHGDNPGEPPVAVDTSGHRVLAISGSSFSYCAIYDDRTLHCWGGSSDGQLGMARTEAFGDSPGEHGVGAVSLPSGRGVVDVSMGGGSACAVLDDGSVRCWGDNFSGQLGQGNTIANYGATPGEATLPVDVGEPARAVFVGFGFACADTAAGLRCWGENGSGQLARGNTNDYGRATGEVPRALPAIDLGGQQIGRDSDGDGVRDAVDACPTVAGASNGCAAPATPPEAVLKGKKVVLDTVLAKKKASAKCPAKAEVTVKTKTKAGRVKVTKQLKTKTVATGCLVKGKVRLPAKPKKSAAVKVAVSGSKLVNKRLIAVRNP